MCEDSTPLFSCSPSVLFPVLLLCACRAVSVDLWYRGQPPPLLQTDHLYLYCRDTAHNDRKGRLKPCGPESNESQKIKKSGKTNGRRMSKEVSEKRKRRCKKSMQVMDEGGIEKKGGRHVEV